MIFVDLKTQKFNGVEIRPGITLIGEHTPVAGTNTMRCLANIAGVLCVVELSIKFVKVEC